MKRFNEWNNIKQSVDDLQTEDHYFKEREIWWCYLGENIGLEQNGKGDSFIRPVLILKKFSRRMCWVLPLSTKVSKGNFFIPVLSESNIIRMTTIPQLRMIDIKRLRNRFDIVSSSELELVKEKVIDIIR